MIAIRHPSFYLSALAASILFIGSVASARAVEIKLSGSEEVPAVATSASGQADIIVSPDKSVSGSVVTTGIDATAAHIHLGAPGKSGPIVLPLVKGKEHTWAVPAGSKLTDAQYQSYQAGELYVNVHSAAHKDGEIRGQIKP